MLEAFIIYIQLRFLRRYGELVFYIVIQYKSLDLVFM